MTLPEAQARAQRVANLTSTPVLVYESLLHPGQYGEAFTLPMFGERIGEPFYPQRTEQQ